MDSELTKSRAENSNETLSSSYLKSTRPPSQILLSRGEVASFQRNATGSFCSRNRVATTLGGGGTFTSRGLKMVMPSSPANTMRPPGNRLPPLTQYPVGRVPSNGPKLVKVRRRRSNLLMPTVVLIHRLPSASSRMAPTASVARPSLEPNVSNRGFRSLSGSKWLKPLPWVPIHNSPRESTVKVDMESPPIEVGSLRLKRNFSYCPVAKV